jgi:hypothetical protein
MPEILSDSCLTKMMELANSVGQIRAQVRYREGRVDLDILDAMYTFTIDLTFDCLGVTGYSMFDFELRRIELEDNKLVGFFENIEKAMQEAKPPRGFKITHDTVDKLDAMVTGMIRQINYVANTTPFSSMGLPEAGGLGSPYWEGGIPSPLEEFPDWTDWERLDFEGLGGGYGDLPRRVKPARKLALRKK